MPHKRLEISIT